MSTSKILLIQYPGISSRSTMSPPCAKVHMALHFKGLPFDIFNCKTPGDIKKFNVRGRVPALQIDGQVYVDSSDILTELDRRWPEPPLMPGTPKLRAQCIMIEDWADEVIYFYGVYLRWMMPENFALMRRAAFSKLPWLLRSLVPIMAKRMVSARLRGQGTSLKSAQKVLSEFRERLDLLEDMLQDTVFFCGEQITRADLAVVCFIDQMVHPELPPAMVHELENRANLSAWRARVHAQVPTAAG